MCVSLQKDASGKIDRTGTDPSTPLNKTTRNSSTHPEIVLIHLIYNLVPLCSRKTLLSQNFELVPKPTSFSSGPKMISGGASIVKRIVISDEIWVCTFDTETAQVNSPWKWRKCSENQCNLDHFLWLSGCYALWISATLPLSVFECSSSSKSTRIVPR